LAFHLAVRQLLSGGIAGLCTTNFTSYSTPNKAIDEVRGVEFFRKGGHMRGVVKGKRWPLSTRWMNLDSQKRQQLNDANGNRILQPTI
jgi:hypothetical protein